MRTNFKKQLICSLIICCATGAINDVSLEKKLFTHAERVGVIKKELVKTAGTFEARFEKQREKTGIKYPKIVPAPTKYPMLNKKFKYGQSVVQLAITLPGTINTPTGPMDYLTYYMYLKDNNLPIDDFLERVIRQAIKLDPNMSYGKTEEEKTAIVEMLKKIILEEEKHTDAYVFYNGYSSAIDLLYDFVTILYNYLNLENRKSVERTRFEQIIKIYSSVQELINTFKLMEEEPAVIDWLFSSHASSFNIGILGNIENPGEASLDYFIKNSSIQFRGKLLKTVRGLCNKLGLSWPIDKKPLTIFLDRYESLGGKLKQVFIRSSTIDDVVYLSRAFGLPLGSLSTSDKNTCEDCLLKHFDLKPGTLLPTQKVLDLLRTDPKNSCFIDNKMGVSELQARILHFHPLFFESRPDIQINYYYAEEDKIPEAKKLKQELTAIVRTMIFEALEKGTLKPTDVKLKNLYAEMKKPLPKESTLKKAAVINS